ncbi:MAG: hypothetical protein ACYS22_04520 [Planctomycetota bacterium]
MATNAITDPGKPDRASSLKSWLPRPSVWGALLANALVLGVLGYCYWLLRYDEGLYHWSVQEDEYLEWGTTWAFLLASVGCLVGARRERKLRGGVPWFYVGLSLFCFLVAMEEISWGQRLLGFSAPTYFLEQNFQQELTVHNLVSTSFRKLALKGIILGYGVVLPLLTLIPPLRRLMLSMRVVVSPLELMPTYFTTFYVYHTYPWDYTGEVIELMLGLCFLFAVLFRLRDFARAGHVAPKVGRQVGIIFGGAVLALGLGVGTGAWSRHRTENDPSVLKACRIELEALKRDFAWKARQLGRLPFRRRFHRRLYTAVKRYELDWMYDRQFQALTKQGLPKDRADFFMDPWNLPYWMTYKGDRKTGRRRSVIYSFGPNRKRDSNDWEIRGDDVGVIFFDTGLDEPYIPENEKPKAGEGGS